MVVGVHSVVQDLYTTKLDKSQVPQHEREKAGRDRDALKNGCSALQI